MRKKIKPESILQFINRRLKERAVINNSKGWLAEQLGMSRVTFWHKLKSNELSDEQKQQIKKLLK